MSSRSDDLMIFEKSAPRIGFKETPVTPTVRRSSAKPVLAKSSSRKDRFEKSSHNIAIETEAINSAPKLDVTDFAHKYPSGKVIFSPVIRNNTPRMNINADAI
jgi:hypothetical protein